jgi:hypothetical protein
MVHVQSSNHMSKVQSRQTEADSRRAAWQAGELNIKEYHAVPSSRGKCKNVMGAMQVLTREVMGGTSKVLHNCAAAAGGFEVLHGWV